MRLAVADGYSETSMAGHDILLSPDGQRLYSGQPELFEALIAGTENGARNEVVGTGGYASVYHFNEVPDLCVKINRPDVDNPEDLVEQMHALYLFNSYLKRKPTHGVSAPTPYAVIDPEAQQKLVQEYLPGTKTLKNIIRMGTRVDVESQKIAVDRIFRAFSGSPLRFAIDDLRSLINGVYDENVLLNEEELRAVGIEKSHLWLIDQAGSGRKRTKAALYLAERLKSR